MNIKKEILQQKVQNLTINCNNKRNDNDNILLGKKRKIIHLFEIDNPIKIKYIYDKEEKYNCKIKKELNGANIGEIKVKEEPVNNSINDNESIKKKNNKINNNDENEIIYKLIQKCAFNFIYDKIVKQSFSYNNELDEEILKIIHNKGYYNVRYSLSVIKKNKFKEINEIKKEKDDSSDFNTEEEEKKNEKELSNPLEYHYNFMNDFYYRYKYLNTNKNIQNYVCCDEKCNAMAILNLKDKKFNVIKKHSIHHKNHSFYYDVLPVKFMKKKKLNHLHIKKNDYNEKYHLEWFK